jgi:hypothetical protein
MMKKLQNKTFECRHPIFWPVSQGRIHCHTAKLEPNLRVSIDEVPLLVHQLHPDCEHSCTAVDLQFGRTKGCGSFFMGEECEKVWNLQEFICLVWGQEDFCNVFSCRTTMPTLTALPIQRKPLRNWNLKLSTTQHRVQTLHCLIFICLDQGFSTGVPWNPRIPRDVARGSARDCDWKK